MAKFHGKRYPEVLAEMSEEEYKEHLRQRKIKRETKAAMDAIRREYANEWAATMHNLAAQMAFEAARDGDVQKFLAVWDRIIGKPKDSIDINTEVPLPWNDEDFK